jgi:hemolysin-activating ACP:hemolysin acyltransferase
MLIANNNGSFGLDEIKKIVKRNSNYNEYYIISFVNDDRKLYSSKYHAFLLENGKTKSSENLKSGDKIWIDIFAFSKDKSLI